MPTYTKRNPDGSYTTYTEDEWRDKQLEGSGPGCLAMIFMGFMGVIGGGSMKIAELFGVKDNDPAMKVIALTGFVVSIVVFIAFLRWLKNRNR